MTPRAGLALLHRLLPWQREARSGPFQLTRYFRLTSFVAFVVLGVALFLLELGEQRFLASVQRAQNSEFALMQAQLAHEQKEAGRTNLVDVYERGHLTLARVFANAVWDSHFVPLIAQAQALSMEGCRAPADADAAAQAKAQQACAADLNAKIMALPAFARLDQPVRSLMRSTTVFKIKAYDLRGLTVYSSETPQVGEDKSGNAGWKAAVAGRPASELVHRNRFSAFEGEVENRDLIQSYIPVAGPGGAVAGVFEIYSDVTPLLQQLDAATARIAALTTRNQAQLQQAAQRNERAAALAATRLMLIIAALLAVVYFTLLFFVRNGQRLIDAEARAREQAALREQAWHRDKMATMGAMAANISHEVGNPLAIIAGLAQEVAQWRDTRDIDPEMARTIVEQTTRIANMTRRISDFATAGHDRPEPLNANELVRSVSDFLAFDKRFHGTPIDLRLSPGLPACEAIPDHLTEVLMGLLQVVEDTCQKECAGQGNRIIVETGADGNEVRIRVGGECAAAPARCALPPDDARLDSARRRLEGMGGRLETVDAGLAIHLPCLEEAATVPASLLSRL